MSETIKGGDIWGWPTWSVECLAGLTVLCGVLVLLHYGFGENEESNKPLHGLNGVHQNGDTQERRKSFEACQRKYLAVYLIIMLADWLQGTNMYTLYQVRVSLWDYSLSSSVLHL